MSKKLSLWIGQLVAVAGVLALAVLLFYVFLPKRVEKKTLVLNPGLFYTSGLYDVVKHAIAPAPVNVRMKTTWVDNTGKTFSVVFSVVLLEKEASNECEIEIMGKYSTDGPKIIISLEPTAMFPMMSDPMHSVLTKLFWHLVRTGQIRFAPSTTTATVPKENMGAQNALQNPLKIHRQWPRLHHQQISPIGGSR